MTTKKFIINSVAIAAITASGHSAAGNLEANIAVSSDYVFRGFSQTMEDPAISGGLDYSFGNGFSIGTWASNVDFGNDATAEVDLYAGYGFQVADGVNLDVSYIYYIYPGETGSLNYSEFQSSLSFSNLSLGLIYSPDYSGSDNSAIILNADYSISLTENYGLDFHVGYSDADAEDFFDVGESSYIDYSASLTTSVEGLDLSLTYYGTDLDNIATADDRLVFSVGKTF